MRVGIEVIVGAGLVGADLVGIAHESVVVEIGALGDGLVEGLVLELVVVFVVELDLPRSLCFGAGCVVVVFIGYRIH